MSFHAKLQAQLKLADVSVAAFKAATVAATAKKPAVRRPRATTTTTAPKRAASPSKRAAASPSKRVAVTPKRVALTTNNDDDEKEEDVTMDMSDSESSDDEDNSGGGSSSSTLKPAVICDLSLADIQTINTKPEVPFFLISVADCEFWQRKFPTEFNRALRFDDFGLWRPFATNVEFQAMSSFTFFPKKTVISPDNWALMNATRHVTIKFVRNAVVGGGSSSSGGGGGGAATDKTNPILWLFQYHSICLKKNVIAEDNIKRVVYLLFFLQRFFRRLNIDVILDLNELIEARSHSEAEGRLLAFFRNNHPLLQFAMGHRPGLPDIESLNAANQSDDED